MITRNDNYGSWLVAGLCLLAIFLWLIEPSAINRFDSAHWPASLGQILGLVGSVLLSVNFILSTRLKVLDRIFFGLNNVYQKHNLFGQLGLIALLLHPLFLLPKYTENAAQVVKFLWLGNTLAINLGTIALWSLVILVALTLYWRPKYHLWKLTHQFLGASLLLAGLHIWLIPSNTANFWPLRVYILVLIGLAIVAFAYRTLFGRWLIKKTQFKVLKINALSQDVIEIRLKLAAGEVFDFYPGQFVFLNFKSDQISSEAHPFSITSGPDDDFVSVTIKKLGDYTQHITKIKPGTLAEIEGPFGVFATPNKANQKQIWIGGGIGITPFVSMAKTLTADSPEVDLFYSIKTPQDAVYLDLFAKITSKLPDQFRVFPIYTDKQGFLTAKAINKVSVLKDKEIFICAPPIMIDSFKKQLIDLGVKTPSIHYEVFDL
ncbi:ferric reductase-like transmembrane domain-containing protein [Candidatus Berkelbacteria bacterium]|nr:ferric reductase-like transmembrane domain-containing protein [Candidatus Berkelbacteria bacterium]